MSRSGYHYELDPLESGRWRAQVMSALRGKRGQSLLVDMVKALEAMPDKRLIKNDLKTDDGEYCALGAVAELRGVDMTGVDPEEPEVVAGLLDIAPQLAQEVVFLNDEDNRFETPEQRHASMLAWAKRMLKKGESA